MGFQYPKYLTDWLEKSWRRPPESFVNSSMYYAELDPFFINYMNNVVRPCLAYANGTSDSVYNSGVKFNLGKVLVDSAVRLIKGDDVLFEGDDEVCKAFTELWVPRVKFFSFLETAIRYREESGTAAVKLNLDRNGVMYPSAARADRCYVSSDDMGNVIHAVFLNSFLFSQKVTNGIQTQYWLVEERKYGKSGNPVVVFKAHFKSGIAGQETMPPLNAEGANLKDLPEEAQRLIKARGIRLNKEVPLPFPHLGVWLYQAIYLYNVGDLTFSMDEREREKAVDEYAKKWLDRTVPELGASITYRGGFCR